MPLTRHVLSSLLPLALLAGCQAAPLMAPTVPNAPASVSSLSGPPSMVRFAEVEKGKLYRGGLPSKEDLAKLIAMGIKTDIDLMGEVPAYDTFYVERERGWAKELGLKFVQVKTPTNSIPFFPKISNEVANAFLKVATDPANQPCFVHCMAGRDRTGTMSAVYRMTQNGYSNERAYAEMVSFGFSDQDYPGLADFVRQYRP